MDEAAAAFEGMTRAALNWHEGECYDVSFAVHKSRRYHAKLRDFFRALDRTVLAASALSGGSAFFVLLAANAPSIATWLTAVVAAATTLNLVFGFSKRADLHDDLCRRFTELAARMVEWEPTPENYRRACAERLRIERDEPSERRLIDLLAQNDEARARGTSPEDQVPLNWAQSHLGYVTTFGMRRLVEWEKERKRPGSTASVASAEKHEHSA